jgi:phosphatidylinositol alpha-1,6-mannosyltransferase
VTLAVTGQRGVQRPGVPYTEVAHRKGVRDWEIMKAIRHHLRLSGRDAPILATLWNPEATLAMLAGSRRVSILAHGNEVMSYGKRGFKHHLRRIVLARARIVICNSRFTEGIVKVIAPKARTAVLNPAVDASAFAPTMTQSAARELLSFPAMTRMVLTVARLDPIKGHETVLRAIAEVPPEQRRALYYVIIGKGEMRAPLEKMAQDLGIAGQVKFAGFVTDQELMAWYTAADIFVLPSLVDPHRRGMEGFGMALTEAQAAGLPVIGTRSGGIPDAVKENEGGWLIDEKDHDALALHLTHLAENPMAFAEQGRLGADRVKRDHDWQTYAAQLLELI